MTPVHLPEPESFWSSLKRALAEHRAAERKRRADAAAAVVAACWPERRPPRSLSD